MSATSLARRVLGLCTVTGLMAGAAVVGAAPAAADEADAADPPLPIVFVHGLAGSGAQYESQAQRFASNGYPADRIRAFEYSTASTLAVIGATIGIHNTAITNLIDDLRDEFGVDQVVLVGHSLGTAVSNNYLSNAGRAARVAKYIGIDGSSSANCGVGNDALDCMGVWVGTNTTGNVGGNNVRLDGETHVEVATSPASFAAQYEFITGEPPATTMVLPEPPGLVHISGRAVDFPANSGTDGATVEVWQVNERTGVRTTTEPIASLAIDASGDWGPVQVNGQQSYELTLVRSGLTTAHYYFQPFLRSSQLVRLLASPPDSAIVANTNVGPDHAAAVIIRNREFWTSHPSGLDDQLEITTTSGGQVEASGNVFENLTANNIIGVHVHDAAATPGESTLAPLPFFPSQPFQTGVDVYMPATSPPDGTITFASAPRGDTSRLQVVNTPNWPSTDHRIVITLNDYVQDIDSWGACKRARPSPC